MGKQKTDRSRPDHYAKRAKKDRYPARSVYKLEEIQKKFRIIRPKDRILDLGCAPGSWLKYAAEITGPEGCVAGLDLKDVDMATLPDHVSFYRYDVLQPDPVLAVEADPETDPDRFPDENCQAAAEALSAAYDVVISDMAPSTTGIRSVDAARSFVLAEAALDIAGRVLVTGGNFVVKIFQGDDFDSFIRSVREQYQTRRIFKPTSTRKESKEIYVIGMGKKKGR